ncbi:hypothetical protein DU976_07025 [Vibrio navarrensis]|nr:hypothetical protein [Vibrio navarrensis]
MALHPHKCGYQYACLYYRISSEMPAKNMCLIANFSKDLFNADANIARHFNNFVLKRRLLVMTNAQ